MDQSVLYYQIIEVLCLLTNDEQHPVLGGRNKGKPKKVSFACISICKRKFWKRPKKVNQSTALCKLINIWTVRNSRAIIAHYKEKQQKLSD